MRRKLAVGLVSTFLALALFAGAAFALTGHQPTVTLTAVKKGLKVKASGNYDPVSTICHGGGGRLVTVYAAKSGTGIFKVIATTHTHGPKFGIGKYAVTSKTLKKGFYDVRSIVPGSVRSGYANTDVCFDASSNTVTVHI